jgi:hypothetical protein
VPESAPAEHPRHLEITIAVYSEAEIARVVAADEPNVALPASAIDVVFHGLSEISREGIQLDHSKVRKSP